MNITCADSSDTTTWAKVREVDIYIEHPEERTDQNQDRIYSYSAADIRVETLVSCSSDAFEAISPLLTRDAQGRLPLKTWSIITVDNAGTSKTISFTGYLKDSHISKKEMSNRIVDLNLTIRIEDEIFTVA